jgi:hypothetical protein
MPVLTATDVQELFDRLALPFHFATNELRQYTTTSVAEIGPRVFCFPIPSQNSGLNLLHLRQLLGVDPAKPPSFFDHPWYLEELFMQTDCAPGWHLIEMDVAPESIERPLTSAGGFTVPVAIEVVLMLFLHYVKTGERLLMKKHTWCRDRATLGRVVTVGAFGRNGVFISAHPPTFASRGLGVCRTFNRPGEIYR